MNDCDLSTKTTCRFCYYIQQNIDNIVGIKEATGDLERAKLLIKKAPEGFAIYSGDDATALELILLGGAPGSGKGTNTAAFVAIYRRRSLPW